MIRTGAFTGALFLAFLAGPSQAQTGPGDAIAGRELAQGECATCHAVDRSTSKAQQAPSFTSIARMPSTTSMSLHAFLLSPHPHMPNYRLSPNEVDDVVSYILTLRGR